MRPRYAIMLAAAVACLTTHRAEGQTRIDVLRIGSWNIEHLGDPGSRRGSGENVTQKAEDLARYIKYSRAEVIALQEIKADGEAPEGFPRAYRTNSIMTRALAEVGKTPGNDWRHVLFPKMRNADTTQWVGVAWNEKRVKPVGAPIQIVVSHTRSSQGSNLWDRNLHGLKFSTEEKKTDFVVFPIHLKANTTSNFASHRGEEISELMKQMPNLVRAFPGESDYIFLGDTNIQTSKEEAVAAFEENGFRDLNRADMDTHTAREIQPFDRVFVPRDQPEFAKSRMQVLSAFQREQNLSFAEFRARYSDHYIITVELSIADDDD
jgi:hypothetical protein